MRQFLSAAALAALALGTAATAVAQTTDTVTFDELRDREAAEEIYNPEPAVEPEIEVEETIAPGEYELREVEDADDFEDYPTDTTGMTPKNVDGRTEWLMEPEETTGAADPLREPEDLPDPKQ